jgi:hypothetical protein
VKATCYILAAVSVIASSVASAKCGTYSVKERLDGADRVVLVTVVAARDGMVPWPYRIQKGALPGKWLTLRVLKSWKGNYLVGHTMYGWTQGRSFEDSYPYTDAGTKILAYLSQQSGHEIRACNAADPERIEEVSAELDKIVSDGSRGVKPNTSLERTRER